MDGPGAKGEAGTPVHVSGQGGDNAMTMPAARTASAHSIQDRVRAIEQTYPRWSIRQRPNGTWSATRTLPPTPTQAAAGLQWHLRRPTLDSLAGAVAEQFVIAQTVN